MGLKNCVECGRICVENPSGLCPECYAKEEEDEHKIGEYLREVGKASIEQIHEATGVKEKTILRMMKSGRVMSLGEISYPCELCGALIFEGRVCAQCGKNFTQQVQEVRQKDGEQHDRDGLRMYTRDRDLKK
jgi:transposase-like protein